MEEIVFIGDELTAAAWRCAGISVRITEPEHVDRVLDEVATDTRLVLLASPHAAALQPSALADRIRQAAPALVIVPDAARSVALPDIANRLRRTLGVAT